MKKLIIIVSLIFVVGIVVQKLNESNKYKKYGFMKNHPEKNLKIKEIFRRVKLVSLIK